MAPAFTINANSIASVTFPNLKMARNMPDILPGISEGVMELRICPSQARDLIKYFTGDRPPIKQAIVESSLDYPMMRQKEGE